MAVVVNRQGKMVTEFIVRAAENILLLELDRSAIAATLDNLGKFIVADDVTFKVSDAEVLGIYGPGSEALLQSPSLPNFHGVMRGSVMVSKNGLLGFEGYDLLIPGGKSDELERILGHGGLMTST